MAASGDVTIAQDGGLSVKVHPYLVAFVRWCVSCLWSSASVLLHRLMTAPLPAIKASKPAVKPRAASYDHLHPEPLVECVVLHQPAHHTLDVIFVHGLYGSLANTWRQGEWRSKYKIEPNTVPLRRTNLCKDYKETEQIKISKCNKNIDKENYCNNAFNDVDESFYKEITKIISDDEDFTAEKFYTNTVLNQVDIIDNYEAQANFVRDLFRKDCDRSDEVRDDKCECKTTCENGCGCTCDRCYSTCWPKDWIKVDYPDARVISVNYTSDPHLWRPLWIKESKRLRLHERAEQMTKQLLGLGVGQRPIIWVGHSKGGLFIKHIYCDAYEAHLKANNLKFKDTKVNMNKEEQIHSYFNKSTNIDMNLVNKIEDNDIERKGNDESEEDREDASETSESNENEDLRYSMKDRATLWENSAGFMFYSVPHRGSPLADIKTPITARSVELLEISKDCSLVLSLHERWVRATAESKPAVNSLVESGRTLMSVLWLRIVSVDSADAGIGTLCGVSVDHREICKPSSRRCLLYKELLGLMHSALYKCQCKTL